MNVLIRLIIMKVNRLTIKYALPVCTVVFTLFGTYYKSPPHGGCVEVNIYNNAFPAEYREYKLNTMKGRR